MKAHKNKSPEYLAEWRRLNPEKARAISIRYRKKNILKIRAMKKVQSKRYRETHPERVREAKNRWVQNNREKIKLYSEKQRLRPEHRFAKYKNSAKNRGYIFELSIDDFKSLLGQKCHYCGSFGKTGIDRKDNTIGYVLPNCLPCCTDCNMFKRTHGYEYFINRCKSIGAFLLEKQSAN